MATRNVRSSIFAVSTGVKEDQWKNLSADEAMTVGQFVEVGKDLDAAAITQLQHEEFLRNTGLKSQQIKQAREFAAFTDAPAYMKGRMGAFEKLVSTLRDAHDAVYVQSMSSGVSHDEAISLARSSIDPLRSTLERAFEKQYPSDSIAMRRAIEKQIAR